jgi:AcrR family transcriptional regulator
MATKKISRAEAREEMNREILRAGRRQLEEVGAAALSLRAVARELGVVSSAVYRYVASRDELLTRLIDAAYNSLGDDVDAAVTASRSHPALDRWIDAAATIRTWAHQHPHEYSLLYGSPVPGYAAPEVTAVSGTRATRALVSIVSDARADKQLAPRRSGHDAVDPLLTKDFAALRSAVDIDVSDAVVLDTLIAWSQLFGLVSFELFNQTRGIVEHHEALFLSSSRRLGHTIGLRS